MNKLYKTVDEQIEYLKEKKKIIVTDEFRHVFEERSYSSLINPYKEFFAYGRDDHGKHIYVKEINFEEIYKIVKLDDEFSATMYLYIGIFEKKFKRLLFEEICSKYVNCENPDLTCTSYVQEIDEFLATDDLSKLPRFCENYPYILSKKGYVVDGYYRERKRNLLCNLIEIGTGLKSDGSRAEKNNQLINHYLKTQTIAPLWEIGNSLTLGEFNILYSMLDASSQRRIVSQFYFGSKTEDISTKKLLNFSGTLEIIRRIRNIVNHYEPIFPFLVSELKSVKKIRNSQVYSVFKFLENSYGELKSDKSKVYYINLEENRFNAKYIKILEMMKEFII